MYESLPTNKETGEKIVPQANPDAKLFNPSPPILHTDSNWPLLTVSKGFFDGVASARSAAAGNGNELRILSAGGASVDFKELLLTTYAKWFNPRKYNPLKF